MCIGNHDNPVSGHNQAPSHLKTTSGGKEGGTRSREKYLPETEWEGQGRRMASNLIEMRIIDRTRRILENKGALTIITNTPPEPPRLPHTIY